MSEWINVNDRLPEQGDMILATNGEVVTIIQVISIERFKNFVTHWMPLPDLPAV